MIFERIQVFSEKNEQILKDLAMLKQKHTREYEACLILAQKEKTKKAGSEKIKIERKTEEEVELRARTYPQMGEGSKSPLQARVEEMEDKNPFLSPKKGARLSIPIGLERNLELDPKKKSPSSDLEKMASVPSIQHFLWRGLEKLLEGIQRIPTLAASPPKSNVIPEFERTFIFSVFLFTEYETFYNLDFLWKWAK